MNGDLNGQIRPTYYDLSLLFPQRSHAHVITFQRCLPSAKSTSVEVVDPSLDSEEREKFLEFG